MSDSNGTRVCIKCGSTDRNSKGRCSPCTKAADAAYRKKNREKLNASKLAWDRANPDRANATKAAWARRNPEKVKAKNDAWSAANYERKKATTAAWGRAHKDRISQNSAAWRSANIERVRLNRAAWFKKNPEAKILYQAARRALKRSSGGRLSPGLPKQLFRLQRGRCACCRKPLGNDYHLDHVMPLALGGANVDANMQLLRSLCNIKKNAKHPVDFMRERGYLL